MLFSAFWGQSFVTELKRISSQAEKKARARRESALTGSTLSVDGEPTLYIPHRNTKAIPYGAADGIESMSLNSDASSTAASSTASSAI